MGVPQQPGSDAGRFHQDARGALRARAGGGRLEGAQQDYEVLERLLPKPPHAIYFGLGEIAAQKKHYKDAIKYFDQYLKIAPVSAPETDTIRKRVQTLKNSAM